MLYLATSPHCCQSNGTGGALRRLGKRRTAGSTTRCKSHVKPEIIRIREGWPHWESNPAAQFRSSFSPIHPCPPPSAKPEIFRLSRAPSCVQIRPTPRGLVSKLVSTLTLVRWLGLPLHNKRHVMRDAPQSHESREDVDASDVVIVEHPSSTLWVVTYTRIRARTGAYTRIADLRVKPCASARKRSSRRLPAMRKRPSSTSVRNRWPARTVVVGIPLLRCRAQPLSSVGHPPAARTTMSHCSGVTLKTVP